MAIANLRLPEATLQNFATRVARFVSSVTSRDVCEMGPIELGEGFCEYHADVHLSDSGKCNILATGYWYHLVYFGGKALGVAVSKLVGLGDDDLIPQGFFFSQLAERLDLAIGTLDAMRIDERLTAGVICIPLYHLHAVVLLGKDEPLFYVVDSSSSVAKSGTEELLTWPELIAVLESVSPADGIVL